MPRSGLTNKHPLAMMFAWWYIRRLIRKRGTAAVASFVAGEGLSFARRPRRRRPLLGLLVALGLVAVGGAVWWRRQGGGDDWGDWEPAVPDAPLPAEPAPVPEPVGEPVAT